MSALPCQGCYADTLAGGTAEGSETYAGCLDDHDFTQSNAVQDATCLGCHSRQKVEIAALELPDVQQDRGIGCMQCHTKREMHGDGNPYASMLDSGAMDVSCDDVNCHPAAMLPHNTAHAIYSSTVHCSACHAQTISSCYNCHFETEAQAHQKCFYGPPPDCQSALQLDFVDYTGAVTDPPKPFDATKWTFLKSGADLVQMLYATPLTAERMQKLSMVMAVEQIDDGVPENFSLRQNYPNPFNPGTTIEFAVPALTHVKLKVYNAIGDEVMALLDRRLAPGAYKFSLNASSLASGVYFYQLETGKTRLTRKMILTR